MEFQGHSKGVGVEHFGISEGKMGVKIFMAPVVGSGYFQESPIVSTIHLKSTQSQNTAPKKVTPVTKMCATHTQVNIILKPNATWLIRLAMHLAAAKKYTQVISHNFHVRVLLCPYKPIPML